MVRPQKEQQDRVQQDDHPVEQGEQEERPVAAVRDGRPQHVHHLQRDDPAAPEGCPQEDPDDQAGRTRSGGFRGAQQSLLQRPSPSATSVLSVGLPHCQGRAVRLSPGSSGSLVGTAGRANGGRPSGGKDAHYRHQGGQEPGLQGGEDDSTCPGFQRVRLQEECHQFPVGGDQPDVASADGYDGHPQGRGGCAEGGSAPQEGRPEAIGQAKVRVHSGLLRHGPAPVSAEPSNSVNGSSGVSNPQHCSLLNKLPESKSRQLEQAADNLIPEAFEALVSHGRLRLLEVACSPNSLLSGTMMELTKDSSAAERCSLFNDCDLRTNQGTHKIIQTIDCRNPEMVWLSPICGPYSVMQNVNQRNLQQCEELQAKRRDALKQYVGCCIVFSYCVQRGIHVAWEWSQSCHAWRLPIIQKLVQKYEPLFSIVRGCRVGLVTDKGDPISKGWKIMTTHPLLHQRLELPCVCKKGTVHVKCEGSLTRKTELYTKTFATRVCKAILQGSDSRAIRDELQYPKSTKLLGRVFAVFVL